MFKIVGKGTAIRIAIPLIVLTYLFVMFCLDVSSTQGIGITTILIIIILGLANLTWKLFWDKLPKLSEWVFPDLSGTWIGEVKSTWYLTEKEFSGNENSAVTILIDQNIFDFTITAKTEKADTETLAYWPEKVSKNYFRIGYVYRHKPNPRSRDTNPSHEGTAYINYYTDKPDEMRIDYYTDRKTTGSIFLKKYASSC